MAKQKPKAKGSRKRPDGKSAMQEGKPNLFERLYNRKKFDILGKKAKGERKHGQSVHDAVDKVSCRRSSRLTVSRNAPDTFVLHPAHCRLSLVQNAIQAAVSIKSIGADTWYCAFVALTRQQKHGLCFAAQEDTAG